jgi:hypothetical protein
MDSFEHKLQDLFEDFEEADQPLPFSTPIESSVRSEAYKNEIFRKALGRLRYLLACERFEERGLILTGYILSKFSNHHPSWTYRRESILKKRNETTVSEEIIFCENILKDDISNEHAWSQIQFCLNFQIKVDYNYQIRFLNELCEKYPSKKHIWIHRWWITQKAKAFNIELENSTLKAIGNAYNKEFWMFRHHLKVKTGTSNLKEEIFIFDILSKNLGSEAIWWYVGEMLETENKFSQNLKDFCLRIAADGLANRFSTAHLIYNELRRVQIEVDHELIKTSLVNLREIFDTSRKCFWEHFEVNYRYSVRF